MNRLTNRYGKGKKQAYWNRFSVKKREGTQYGKGYYEQKIDQIGKSSFNGECFNKPNGYGEG